MQNSSVIRRAGKGARTTSTYICLSCRLHSRRGTADGTNSTRQPSQLRTSHGAPQKDVKTKRRRLTATTSDSKWASLVVESDKERNSTRRRHGTTSPLFQHRTFHSSRPHLQQSAAAAAATEAPSPLDAILRNLSTQPDIRSRLRKWQELHGNKEEDRALDKAFQNDDPVGETSNTFSRLPDISAALRGDAGELHDQHEAEAHFMNNQPQDYDGAYDARLLMMGDLVELEFVNQDRESVVAVFIRRLDSGGAQLFTMTGRWIFAEHRHIPYSIRGWAPLALVEPLLEHLPNPKDLEEREVLVEQGYVEDLSIPRNISAPLVDRMVQFWRDSQEIYRKHSSALDNAHEILAHGTDLRYGSLVSAASTLLRLPQNKLPDTALFTVRNALTRAGFAFNIDRRLHRQTGYLQIRSKEQVKMVNNVRTWIRDWQDDMASQAARANDGDTKAYKKRHVKETAQHVYSFLDKVRNILLESRKDRVPTMSGNVSPSKKRFAITPQQASVKVTKDRQFTAAETEIIRFIEAWSCSNMFLGLPQFQALPPLLLHATGMYEGYDHGVQTGWQLLQELGTIMPYENRVRFDQHLLLPSSQHSKPLQTLMASLMDMKQDPRFLDSMADLRHDWGELPVYCIDDASAQEIDDGISIESAGPDQWWVHVHVANPTAFFERDHPLAKMARHMGETLYMPERTYVMLPRWATQEHFSLASNRPCLTFSARLDLEGRIQDLAVKSGVVRNVIRLTQSEVGDLIGMSHVEQSPLVTVTVGGELPRRSSKSSGQSRVSQEQIQQLKTLQMLAQKRSDVRSANGGVFYSTPTPEVEIWQSDRATGLSWDHPYRAGRRTVEGDPILQMQTRGLTNFFSSSSAPGQQLVQEMMLTAAEVAGMWCSRRQIPAVFRGTLRVPGSADPDAFVQEVMEPAAKNSPDGLWPMHMGMNYMRMIGVGAIRTRPFKHGILGMNHFCKATSPLRRYGDMILHWQIEAALREEAKRGTSLFTDDPTVDRRFLPFSSKVLDTIVVGLQPREQMISRAKASARSFWAGMVLFRAIHYNEAELPFATPAYPNKPPMRVWIAGTRSVVAGYFGFNIDLNVPTMMRRPEALGMETAQEGDVWECEPEFVHVVDRRTWCKPLRLVERAPPIPAGWLGAV